MYQGRPDLTKNGRLRRKIYDQITNTRPQPRLAAIKPHDFNDDQIYKTKRYQSKSGLENKQ